MRSILEMHKLFNSRDVKILLKLVKFINIINAVCIMYIYRIYSHTLRGGQKSNIVMVICIDLDQSFWYNTMVYVSYIAETEAVNANNICRKL